MPDNQDAGVQLHKNGRYWQARWRDNHGQRRTKSLGSRDKLSHRKAMRECSLLAAELAKQPGLRDQSNQSVRLGEWWTRFQSLRADLSSQSLRLYGDAAGLMLEHWGPEKKIETVTHLEAAEFAAWVEKRYSNLQTARKHLRHAKAILARAKRLHLIAVNPFDGVTTTPPEADKDWDHISREDFDALLSHASQGWRAMLGLLRYAGLRRGEAVRLAWDDIDFEARTLTVKNPGQVRTTKKRKRVVPIQPALYAILLDRFNACPAGETVTGLTMNNLDRAARVLIKRAGLEQWEDIFHTLRKNCESEWLAQHPLLDVCAWLGHNPKVAAQHYHQVQQHVLDDVTGRSSEREATELERVKAENALLRRRLRRVIALARRSESA